MYCEWYSGICPQKGCNGEGYVHCKMRKREVISDKITRQYRNSAIKNERINKVPCLSFLEKTLIGVR